MEERPARQVGLIYIKGVGVRVIAAHNTQPMMIDIEPITWARIRHALARIAEHELERTSDEC